MTTTTRHSRDNDKMAECKNEGRIHTNLYRLKITQT